MRGFKIDKKTRVKSSLVSDSVEDGETITGADQSRQQTIYKLN